MLFPLKLALLAFWAVWFAIVFLTNLFGALKAAGKLAPEWKFASKNYEMVQKAVSLYAAPAWLPRFLFLVVLAWQLAAAVLFACAFVASLQAGAIAAPQANLAFAAGILLWAAFMIADEITIKYAMEQPHELLLITQIACFLLVALV
ncbi:MAG: hypothetical protein H7Y14_07565 [Burkholderiales bacterium]|nr:hypothetical protein [Burkholderiales bacterium]